MTTSISFFRLPVLVAALVSLLLLAACGGAGDTGQEPTATIADLPTVPAATEVPTLESSPLGRAIGDYEGVTFVVSPGSEATFTVEEQLVDLPLPNDAVMRTAALSGEVHLDGRLSVVSIDLQTLASDQRFRDSYVRNRMFGEHPTATFAVPDIGPIPAGLAAGDEVMTQVTGSLYIRGRTFSIEFEIEARDDGDEMFVVGRTTFTWEQLNIPRPTARSVASIEDDVRVNILLSLTPEDN